MSKICENCGNMIPDGTDICPSCGREDDSAIAAVMSELGDAFGDLEPVNVDAKKTEKSKKAADEDDTMLFDADTVSQLIGDSGKKQREDKPEEDRAPKKRPSSGSGKKPSGQSGKNSKNGKNGKKKDNSKTLLGVVIALIVILVVVAGAAVGMLYKMGFFTPMSDDELLGVVSQAPAASMTEVSEAPAVTEAPVVPEDSAADAGVASEAPVEDSLAAPEEAAAETPAPTVECTKFKVTGADDMTFFSRGETAEIVYVVEPAEAKSAIVWESSDDTIATVSEYGVISARRGGNCTITGTCGDQSVSVNVICDFTVPTSVLDMNYEDITMDHEGQTVQLSIDYELTDDQIAATVWESSDEAVATVDKNGLITAVADGTAVVTASIGDYTASCIVRCVKVTGNKGVNSEDSPYVINYQDVTLSRKGEYFQLTLKTITGEEMPEYAWTSSDNSVATVDSKGIVTAVANGTCKITTSVGGDDFECIVRVSIAS